MKYDYDLCVWFSPSSIYSLDLELYAFWTRSNQIQSKTIFDGVVRTCKALSLVPNDSTLVYAMVLNRGPAISLFYDIDIWLIFVWLRIWLSFQISLLYKDTYIYNSQI